MRLWEYDEFGEPWLENGAQNPPLIIVNKKGTRKMARSKYARRKSRSGRKHNAPRRKRYTRRRNPYPMAGTVVSMNPRKRRRGRKRSNPRRKRHYRRNPAALLGMMPSFNSVLYAGAGFIVPPMVEGFISRMLPVTLTSNVIGKYAVRIASVLGTAYLTKTLIGSSEARMVAIGGGAYVLTTAVAEFAPGVIPGLGHYARSTRPSLEAYRASTGRTFNQLGAPVWGARNSAASAPSGAANIVSMRFRRFQ